MEKRVQISASLFEDMIEYINTAGPDIDPDLYDKIYKALQARAEAQERRRLYTASKTAKDPQVKEDARKAYLDAQGIPEAFRW